MQHNFYSNNLNNKVNIHYLKVSFVFRSCRWFIQLLDGSWLLFFRFVDFLKLVSFNCPSLLLFRTNHPSTLVIPWIRVSFIDYNYYGLDLHNLDIWPEIWKMALHLSDEMLLATKEFLRYPFPLIEMPSSFRAPLRFRPLPIMKGSLLAS